MKQKPPNKPESAADKLARAVLAFRILTSPRISISSAHISKVEDSANARANLVQALTLRRANQSCYENAPCGTAEINLELMRAMLDLAQTYSFHVNELAGGSHSKNSRHYAGVAMDIDSINGEPVSSKNQHVSGFMKRCAALGATEVLGPGSKGHNGHVHAAWPRA
jgi:zinc D-Ala-D-Ala carboxypeptidase